ncbi:NAD(P)/FAD-dependent oxidoreductase [soil metagenome]
MSSHPDLDAVVVGSGPNGLAAAITLARAGLSVMVLEAADAAGGGARTAEITRPGFRHDICSSIHPLAIASPFFRSLSLAHHGLEFVQPPFPFAHPLPDGSAAVLRRSVAETAASLGPDASGYRRLMEPLSQHVDELMEQFLGPLRLPRHPLVMARFGLNAVRSVAGLAGGRFSGPHARALLAGTAAHGMLPLTAPATAGLALMFGAVAHGVGWPAAEGGSSSIVKALVSCLHSFGGRVETGRRVRSLADLPAARAVLLDTTPRGLLDIAGTRLPPPYRRRLERFRYGPGVFKIDYALDGPIPWKASECAQAGTVHVGGRFEEIARSEQDVADGRHPDRPYMLVTQASSFDASRAPAGKHTGWVYCHVPNGSTVDMTERIEGQLERFAPGFKDQIIERRSMNTSQLEDYNANYVGGDINGGLQDIRQLFTRPVVSLNPYATPVDGLYLCSSSTPPGGGVHGMCGMFAARAALRASFPDVGRDRAGSG